MKKIPKAKTKIFGKWSGPKELKQKVRAWAEKNLAGSKVSNKSFSHVIEITKQGIKHDISRSYGHPELKLKSITALKEMLRVARYQGKTKDKKGRRDVVWVHHLVSNVDIDGDVYPVWLVVKETKEKQFFYDHGIVIK